MTNPSLAAQPASPAAPESAAQQQAPQNQPQATDELSVKCGEHRKKLIELRRIKGRLQVIEEGQLATKNRAAVKRYKDEAKDLRERIDKQEQVIDGDWVDFARELMAAYLEQNLLAASEDEKWKYAEDAERWIYEQQEEAIASYIHSNWHAPGSPFRDIRKRHHTDKPEENINDHRRNNIFTILQYDGKLPENHDLSPNCIEVVKVAGSNLDFDRDPDSDPGPSSRASAGSSTDQGIPAYAVTMLEKLKRARTCEGANEWKQKHRAFNNRHYVEGDVVKLANGELPPFHADRKELKAVKHQMELLCDDNFKECIWSEFDIRILVHALLMETKLRLTKDKRFGLFATRDLEIRSGAVYRYADDQSEKTFSITFKPDFRLSILMNWLQTTKEEVRPKMAKGILKNELCFMQCEIKKGINNDDDVRAKLFFQMIESICRQERQYYGTISKDNIRKAHAPFCVGAFLHGFQIDFYLAVPAHPDDNEKNYRIYHYKTVKLVPRHRNTIDRNRYVEASVAFCNQVDLKSNSLPTERKGVSLI
ncbi:hypothetical protein THASP1DRAFT_33751 [Thamnocephalis sphaerospora]|uniref:Uncharacterized protein n=1 Tax=Thamnocephalis sphaerospora TaxID=78915 RepID=A0A4V1IVL5_9FUNG|nr:hypothetical protein THASP1DRAFT_33751 [Thamnocephalis sphaerospora]|eukprot:RKP04479.1 hypothetical protein THASP1DRAFT_33751 [Thamnocephalis sphaerospora]